MRKKITLVCEECLTRNYTISKNPLLAKRFELNKFCSTCNKYTNHKETK